MGSKRALLVGALALATFFPRVGGATGKGDVLIVIPVRYRVVQFSFDVAKLRSVYLVAYDADGRSRDSLLYVWDNQTKDWLPTSIAAYNTGSIFLTAPESVFLVGSDRDLPAEISGPFSWAGDVTRIQSLNVVDLVNGLHGRLKFSASEWRWLARRYGLQLEDRNAERRRYGRYGPPGAKKPARSKGATAGEDFAMPSPVYDTVQSVTVADEPVAEQEVSEVFVIPELAAQPVIEEKGAPAPSPAPGAVEDIAPAEDVAPEDK